MIGQVGDGADQWLVRRPPPCEVKVHPRSVL
jgi:hypothetical protein